MEIFTKQNENQTENTYIVVFPIILYYFAHMKGKLDPLIKKFSRIVHSIDRSSIRSRFIEREDIIYFGHISVWSWQKTKSDINL